MWKALHCNGNVAREITVKAAHLTLLQNTVQLEFARRNMTTDWSTVLGHRRENYRFPEVNVIVHAKQATKKWLSENRANVVDWPTCSPDLNSMESLSRILARRVYCNHRQFQTIDELKTAIIEA
ncbi:hypothetical protein ANCDUO_23186 [Ancylostoma duodenale]|uniref:Tc1-like transposase DDE domain-containing protein n=1 Tax=Ancylostoma duodenale TaxID=51022 RepID=A0A0C2FJ28_9BILA|nr:hypothetical protein ANCDUO_23186 [Ancylostoma duodenale]